MIDGLGELIDRAQRLEKEAGEGAGQQLLVDEFEQKGMPSGLAKGLAEDAVNGHRQDVNGVLQKSTGADSWADVSFVHEFHKDVHPGGGQHGQSAEQIVATREQQMGQEGTPSHEGPMSSGQHGHNKGPQFPMEEAAHNPEEMVELAHQIRKMDKGCQECCGAETVEECTCGPDCPDCNCAEMTKALEKAEQFTDWGETEDAKGDVEKFPEGGDTAAKSGEELIKALEEQGLSFSNEAEERIVKAFDQLDAEKADGEEELEEQEDEPDAEEDDGGGLQEPDPEEAPAPEEDEGGEDVSAIAGQIEDLTESVNTLVDELRPTMPGTDELNQGGEVQNDRTDPVTQEAEEELEQASPMASDIATDEGPDELGSDEGMHDDFPTHMGEKFAESLSKTRYMQKARERQNEAREEQINKAFEETKFFDAGPSEEKMQGVGNAQEAPADADEYTDDRSGETTDDADLHKGAGGPFGVSVRQSGV